MSVQTLANVANILRDKYGNLIEKSFTQRGPGNWLFPEQTFLGLLAKYGKVYIGGKDAPNGSNGRYAAQWPIQTATASAVSFDATEPFPAATPEAFDALAVLNYKRVGISLEIDNMLRVAGRGDQLVGNVDSFVMEFEAKLRALVDAVEQQLASDGTGNSNKDITGFKAFLSTSNTYAGISQSSNSYWRAQSIAAGSAAISHALVRQMIRSLWNQGGISPNLLCVMSMVQWHKYLELHQNLIRYAPGGQTGVDLRPMISDGNYSIPVVVVFGVPDAEVWFLNLDKIEMRFTSQAALPSEKGVRVQETSNPNVPNMPVGFESVESGKDTSSLFMKVYGQLVCTNPRYNGIISGLAT